MLSNSLNSKGATPGSFLSGLFKPKLTPNTGQPQQSSANMSMNPTQMGSNPGLMPGVNNSSQQNTTTVKPDGTKVITQAAKGNPSVLAQQQMLNQKYGAGLVEDGISGPKTSAAIQRYLSGQTSSPTAPQPSTTASTAPAPKPTPTYKGLVTDLANQGDSEYNQANKKSINSLQELSGQNLGNSGPAYDEYQKALQDLQNLKTEAAKVTGGIGGQAIGAQFQQGKKQVMQQQYADLIDAAAQNVAAKASALGYGISGQGQQQSGFTSAGNLALSGQGQAQSAIGTAAGLAAPQQYGLTTQPYNPLTDSFGGGGPQGAIDRATNAGNIQSAQSFAQDYNTGQATLRAADGIQKQIVTTLNGNPTLNSNPVSFLTEINKYLSGQLGSAPQQLLAQQVNSYIQTLGLDPASVVDIASQQGGTLAQLLESLRTTKASQVESMNPKNLSGSTGGGSNTGWNF
jgi:hypothetical protein